MFFTGSHVDGAFDDLGYRYAPTATRDMSAMAEVRLWCAVLERACIDAGIIRPETAPRAGKLKGPSHDAAKRFLLRDKKDFYLVCGLAGVNPAVIRMGASVSQEQRDRVRG